MATKWLGGLPEACDICAKPLPCQFIDGATRQGPWAIMCPACHGTHGVGLGTGRGQVYDSATGEKLAG